MIRSTDPRLPGRPFALGCVILFALGGIVLPPASEAAGSTPKVYISKFRKRDNRDHIQLKNEESLSVDVGGWTLSASEGDYIIEANTTIAGDGGTRTFVIDEITKSRSEHILLIDDLEAPASGSLLVDEVRWGCAGGAPAPPAFPDSAALVRVPDPDFLPPQAPPDDETWWTIDLNADFGLDNTAPSPQLGSSLRINEVRIGAGAVPDSVEIFNPFPVPQIVNAWFVTSAAGVSFLNGVVPPFAVTAFVVPDLDLAATERLDLYDQVGVRVDQKAWCLGPYSECYGCCPDGSGPSNGYTYGTSGGGLSWFGLPCTLGEPNHPDGEPFCDPAALPGDELPGSVIEESGWGEIKTHFR